MMLVEKYKSKCNRKIKKAVSSLCIISLCVTLGSSFKSAAYTTYTIGGLTLIASNTEMIVNGYDPSENLDGKVYIGKSITVSDTKMEVIGIKSRVFEGKSLSSLEIEVNDGYQIGSYAFHSAKIGADSSSEGITKAEIGGGKVQAIGSYAFSEAEINCDMNIKSMNGTIGKGAFQNAVFQGGLNIYGSIDTVGDYAFSGFSAKRIWLPETIKNIGDGAFSNTGITMFILSDSLETLGSKVFDNCNSLSTITLSTGDALKEVAEDAFPDKEGLTIIIPEGVTDLSMYHLENYTNLVFQTPENLSEDSEIIQYLKQNHFLYKIGENGNLITPSDPGTTGDGTQTPDPGTTGDGTQTPDPGTTGDDLQTPAPGTTGDDLQTPAPGTTGDNPQTPDPGTTGDKPQTPAPSVDDKKVSDADSNSSNVSLNSSKVNNAEKTETKKAKKKIYKIKNIKYKIYNRNSVVVMGPAKKNMTKLQIPNTVTINSRLYKVVKIKNAAFRNQKKLKKVSIGNYVTEVGNEAFAQCKKLQRIQFGTNIAKLGKKVLYQDKKLKKIIFKGRKLKKIGKKTFYGVSKTVDIRAIKTKAKYYAKLINRSKS